MKEKNKKSKKKKSFDVGKTIRVENTYKTRNVWTYTKLLDKAKFDTQFVQAKEK